MKHTIKLAILGSGNGTNAQQITEYFADKEDVEIVCIIYNMKDAYIAQRARNLGVEAHYFGRKAFYESSEVLDYLRAKEVDWVILAGFLWLVPQPMLDAYPNLKAMYTPGDGNTAVYRFEPGAIATFSSFTEPDRVVEL